MILPPFTVLCLVLLPSKVLMIHYFLLLFNYPIVIYNFTTVYFDIVTGLHILSSSPVKHCKLSRCFEFLTFSDSSELPSCILGVCTFHLGRRYGQSVTRHFIFAVCYDNDHWFSGFYFSKCPAKFRCPAKVCNILWNYNKICHKHSRGECFFLSYRSWMGEFFSFGNV